MMILQKSSYQTKKGEKRRKEKEGRRKRKEGKRKRKEGKRKKKGEISSISFLPLSTLIFSWYFIAMKEGKETPLSSSFRLPLKRKREKEKEKEKEV